MPKRKQEDSEEYIRRKMKKLEKKLKKRLKRTRRISSSSSMNSPARELATPPVTSLPADDTIECTLPPTSENIAFDDTLMMEAPSSLSPQQSKEPAQSEDIQILPSTSVTDNVQDPELEDHIMSLLGEVPSKDKKYGPKIQKDLSLRWEHIATCGLTNENKKELLEKYPVPENCTKIDPPLINPEVKSALSETLAKRDKALEQKQKLIAAAISSLSQALTLMFVQENKDSSIVKHMIEAGRLMCDLQHNESMIRRSFICSTIKKEVKDHLYDTEIDKFLFGERLSETLKTAKAINRSGAEIKNNTRPATRVFPPKRTQKPNLLNYKPQLTPNRVATTTRRQDLTPGASWPRIASAPQPRQPPPPPPPPPQPPRYSQRPGQQRMRR